MGYNVLVINPGSTSTKIAVFSDETSLFSVNIEHSDKEINSYDRIVDQFDFRKDCVIQAVEEAGFDLHNLHAVVGRGGQIPNIHGGGYTVNEDMKQILMSDQILPHASNLGALIADAIARPLHIPAYIYDAIGTDEMSEVAKITGIPEVRREPFCHVLNTKAMGRKYAASLHTSYDKLNLLIVHMGGGISISAHQNGKIIDVVSDDGGPFSPERAGSFPLMYLVDICYSGKYTKKELSKKLRGNGGMKAYLGTSNCKEIESRIQAGDKTAKSIYDAQVYQIAKGIGNLLPVFHADVDAIILTGGIAYSEMMTSQIRGYVERFAPVIVMPGEHEMEALALGAERILAGEEEPNVYTLPSQK